MKAIGYVRVSTEEQANEGISLEAQESAVRAYATMRGFELVEVIRDAGVSGAKALSARRGGAAVLEAVGHGRAQAVIAYKLDRLFRDAADCLEVTKAWDRREVALHLIDLGGQAIDTSTAMGRFFLTVIAGAAEMERNLIAERTSTAMAHLKGQGKRVGSEPYGFRAGAGGVLEPEPYEQGIVAQARAWRSQGASLRDVRDRLEAGGYRPRGRAWHLTTVSRMLKAA